MAVLRLGARLNDGQLTRPRRVPVKLHGPVEVRALLDEIGASPRRAFGQNFVIDANTVRRIAHLAGVGPGDHVIEVGAGLGSLTLALAETGAAVTAIEVDRDLVPLLRRVVEPVGVTVIEADAMELDWASLVSGRQFRLVANLPYNVATPLVLDVLDNVPEVGELLVMVQREAGERLVAAPGSKIYGAPSVKVRYWADAELVGPVPATVFYPVPKVESVLVRIIRRDEPRPVDSTVLTTVVRAAFSQRRKMLRSSLGSMFGPEDFAAAGVDATARPEVLDVDAWCRLALRVSPEEPR